MERKSKEIEMQTYSFSYAYPVNYPTALPYSWDGECHLAVNHALYRPDEDVVPELADEFFADENKEAANKVAESPACIKLSPMSCGFTPKPDKPAEKPVSSLSTEAASSAGERAETIDQQLDFILESVKKQKKAPVKKPKEEKKKKKLTRTRKTTSQLEMLQNEVGVNDVLDKVKMKALAEKTGLKVGQVYKWYWDYRRKVAGQSQLQSMSSQMQSRC